MIIEDLEKIARSLPRKTGKNIQLSSNKVNVMIINHRGKITIRELMIQYLLKGIIPVLEAIVIGGIYKKPHEHNKENEFLVQTWVNLYRIQKEFIRIKSPKIPELKDLLDKIKNVPTLDFDFLKDQVSQCFGVKALR